MTSKQRIISQPRIIVSLLCAFMINSYLLVYVGSTPTYKEMEIIDDLPVKGSLEKYLLALEKIVYFVNAHRFYVDFNMFLGFFFIDVNLRTTVQMRGHRLTAQKRVRLERLLKTIEELETYFFKMVTKKIEQIKEAGEELSIGLVNLFTNQTIWVSHLRSFNIELLKQTKFYTRKELESIYFKWPAYKRAVYTFETVSPAPSESDACLELLSQNPLNEKARLVHCQVPYMCAKSILNGTHYGYGITHRFLFLLVARHARGCALLTPAEDKDLSDLMCAHMYNEAEFIAYHDFEIIDLFNEILCVCSFEGHAQFLRRSWIEELLDFQTSVGCFNLTRPGEEESKQIIPQELNYVWQFIIHDQKMLGGSCSVHTTSVAASTLSTAIRYILESYY